MHKFAIKRNAMFTTIYFDIHPLILTDDVNALTASVRKDHGVIEIDLEENMDRFFKNHFENPEPKILVNSDLDSLQEKVFSYFKIIEAAGGIVLNPEKEILFIHRRGKWDLPKGKLEKGEDKVECAQREVEEETNIGELKYIGPVGITYHHYVEKGKHILKISHWYYFTTTSTAVGVPQTEEDISEVKWISTVHIKEPMQNTFETIRDILTVFFDKP